MIFTDNELKGYKTTDDYNNCTLAVLYKENDMIIKKLGLRGIICLTMFSCDSPNTFYISKECDLGYYINFIERNSKKFREIIIESTKKYGKERELIEEEIAEKYKTIKGSEI